MANCALLRAGVEACVPEEHGSRVAAVGQVDTVGVVVDGRLMVAIWNISAVTTSRGA